MRLEGTLDAFSLPDIFSLLSSTRKTGTLHLRRDGAHGAVHLREGAVTGARADVARQELSRRLLGAGIVDDEALASAAEELAADEGLSLAQLLAEKADLGAEQATSIAVEQITDAVFSLLRWADGEFAFIMDEADPDDLGAALAVADVVAEGQRRMTAWAALVEQVPAPDAVVTVNAAPDGDPAATREEWALLSLVDGRRTVADLVVLSGKGEYAVVSALAGLIGRGLLHVGAGGDDQLVRRQRLLAALEGAPVHVPPPASDRVPSVPAQERSSSPVIPARPEPFTPTRRPEHGEDAPAHVRAGARATTVGAGHGSVDGATALQPGADPVVVSLVERDPSINKSLLLRLIAGVRGL